MNFCCMNWLFDSIVQGADWHFGPTVPANKTEYPISGQPKYVKYTSLVSFILAFVLLALYLALQVMQNHSYVMDL